MTLIYLIRHGRPQSDWGGADHDPGLDDVGSAQARSVADRLMALQPADRPVRVVSSPLRRCRETAEPTARALGVAIEIDPAVGEIPTPAGLAEADRPAWLRSAMEGNWADIVGDLDYDQWRKAAATALIGHAGAAVFSHFVAINGVLSTLSGDPRVITCRPDHTAMTTLRVGVKGLELAQRGAEAATGVL